MIWIMVLALRKQVALAKRHFHLAMTTALVIDAAWLGTIVNFWRTVI